MQWMTSFWHFFIDNFPSWSLIIWLFPLSFIWSIFALALAGFCKKNLHWKTGYTRKLFHFLIFGSAVLYQQFLGLQGVFVLGWSVTIILIFACIKGKGNILYEALAREKDAPHRTKYIVFSYVATFLGGVLSNLFFGKLAIFGYAVTGIADAVAEPIGTMFGKHFYNVFSFHSNKISQRSIEGSMSVLLSSFIVYYLMFFFFFFLVEISVLKIVLISIICMLTEALSPSGFDNLLLQIVAGGLAYYMIQ